MGGGAALRGAGAVAGVAAVLPPCHSPAGLRSPGLAGLREPGKRDTGSALFSRALFLLMPSPPPVLIHF